MIRTWSLQSYSLVTLKGLLMKYLTAMATAAAAESQGPDSDDPPSPSPHNHQHQHHHPSGGLGGLGGQGGTHASLQAEIEASNPFGGPSGGSAFGAMAISPITLLHEWAAHKSPFISREFCGCDDGFFFYLSVFICMYSICSGVCMVRSIYNLLKRRHQRS